MQQITITGHVGKDATIREITGSSRKAISFSVAVNDSYKDAQGNRVDRTSWYDVTKWVDQGQSTAIVNYLKKGQQVLVQGKPAARCYQLTQGDNAGKWAAAISIEARGVELLGKAPESNGPVVLPEPTGQQLGPHRDAQPQRPAPIASDDNDLPF